MTTSLKDALDNTNLNQTAEQLRAIKLGSMLAQLPLTVQVAVSSNKATMDPPCARILKAYASAGTTKGEQTPEIPGTSLSTKQCAPDGNGNVLFYASDAVTQAEITYQPYQGQTVTEVCQVVSHAITFAQDRAGLVIISAEDQAGTALTVDVRGTSSPASGHIALTDAGTGAKLYASGSETSVTITYIATPGVGDQPSVGAALLAGDATF